MENKVTAAYEREIKTNLVINGLVEDKNESKEDLLQKIKSFFKEELQIENEIEINDVFCMGGGKVWSIMIKLKDIGDKASIFSHSSNLKGKKNSLGKAYFIQDDQSDQQAEMRGHYRDLTLESKQLPEDKSYKVKKAKGKIMVNNESVKARVQTQLVQTF